MAARGAEVNLDSRLGGAKEARMEEEIVPPAACRDMAEVRRGVDSLDRRIVALLSERFRYMDAAARIKERRESVRDERRKAEVIEKVRASARGEGAPEDRIAAVYDLLVENSIQYEFDSFDRLRSG